MKIAANSAVEPEKKKFDPIPAGTYPCKVIDVLVKQSENAGEYWTLKLEIQSGKYDGKFIYDSLFFTPKALRRFFLTWKRLTGFELDPKQELHVDENDLLGCKANVNVAHQEREYKGEKITEAKPTFDAYSIYDDTITGVQERAAAKKTAEADEEEDNIPF